MYSFFDLFPFWMFFFWRPPVLQYARKKKTQKRKSKTFVFSSLPTGGLMLILFLQKRMSQVSKKKGKKLHICFHHPLSPPKYSTTTLGVEGKKEKRKTEGKFLGYLYTRI